MPHHARSHDESRDVVCVLCFRKVATVRNLSNDHKRIIEEHFIEGLNYDSDDRLPRVICDTCL